MGSSSFLKCNNDMNTVSKKATIILDEKEYIWIDPQIENEENKSHYNDLFADESISCSKFNNIDEGYNYLTQKEKNYKEIIIIISGKLFMGNYLIVSIIN